MWRQTKVKGRAPVILVALFVLGAVLPVYAYGDPSGGLFFQILMPTLAAIWGMWMVFANSIRRRFANLLRKLRGTTAGGSGNSLS
jgi:hypothetical protein